MLNVRNFSFKAFVEVAAKRYWALGSLPEELSKSCNAAGPAIRVLERCSGLHGAAGSGDGSSSSHQSYVRKLEEEVRVARAGKASSDYLRRRDADATTTSSSSAGTSSGAGEPAAAVTTEAYGAGRAADSEVHPSRSPHHMNAYARGALSAPAGGPGEAQALGSTSSDGGAAAYVYGSAAAHPRRRRDDHDELEDLSGWQPVTMGESGIEAIVERRIRDSVARGELDKLKGHGQPLDSVSRHDAQFYRVDPLMAALTRSMGAQAVRPRSLELRDELHRAREEFEQAVRAEVRKVVAAAGSGSAGSLRGQGRGEGPAGGTGREAEVEGMVEKLVERRLPGLSYKYDEVQRLRGQYNGAVLADKETYGSGWPLEPVRRLEFGQEVARLAREELGSAGCS